MRSAVVIFVLLLIATAAFSPHASAQQIHQDTTYGYKIAPPIDWPSSPRETDSQWVIAKFVSKKPTYYNDPEGWTWTFTPEMTVIAFVHEVIKGDKVKKEEGEDGESVTISIRDPYKDYKDYLQRTYYGGGFFFSGEEESSVKDVPVTCYEVTVEKLTRTGPRRIIAWVYHLEDMDIAVQFEILEKSYTKMRRDISRTLNSFRVIDRAGELPAERTPGFMSRINWEKLDLKERNLKRKELEEKAHEKALADLPKGWKRSTVGRILVLDSFNPGQAKKVAQQCNAIMDWLDKNFDFIGPDEYVRSPILKVFKAEDPNSFSFSYGGILDNIVIEYEHNPGWLSELNFELVSRRVLAIWFNDRDRELYWAMPKWVEYGLEDLFENSRAKGSRLEFPTDSYDRVHLKQALSKGELSTARELMMMGSEQFFSSWYKRYEASALVRFLVTGPGSKSKKTRDVFRQYLQNLADVTAEIKQEKQDREVEKPKTEEEEDEYFKAKQNAWKDEEKRVLEDTFNRTFFDWDDKDWTAFEAAYTRSIDD